MRGEALRELGLIHQRRSRRLANTVHYDMLRKCILLLRPPSKYSTGSGELEIGGGNATEIWNDRWQSNHTIVGPPLTLHPCGNFADAGLLHSPEKSGSRI
jgi:hypothetical protein